MRSRRPILILLAVIIGLFVLAFVARARLPQRPLIDGDNLGVTQHYQLDTLIDDSLFIVADQVALGVDSHVTGNAAFVSSHVEVGGRIDGSLTVTGDAVVLLAGARVGGDLTLIADDARVDGEVVGNITFSGDEIVLAPDAVLHGEIALCSGDIVEQRANAVTPSSGCANLDLMNLAESFRTNVMLQSSAAPLDASSRLIWGMIGTVFATFLLTAISTLGVALFPVQLGSMGRALRRPRSQFITGLLTVLLLIGGGTGVLMLLAVIPNLAFLLVPVAFIAGATFLLLMFAGMIPIALVLGDWLLGRVSSVKWPPLVAASFGSLVLVLLVMLPALVPYGVLLSLLVIGLVGTVAVGAALSTRLGTRGRQPSYFVQS